MTVENENLPLTPIQPQIQTQTLQRSAYRVEIIDTADTEILNLRAPDGQLCLQITLTPEGPRIAVQGLSVAVECKGDLKIEAENVAVRARKELRLESGENVHIDAVGEFRAEAFEQHLRARRGDIALKANDDVLLNGERIRLNSPRTPADLRALTLRRREQADGPNGTARPLDQEVSNGVE